MNKEKNFFEDEINILENKIIRFNNIINDFRKQNNVDELLLKEQLNDLLGQFEVCLKYTIISDNDGSLISAIKYANNIKKHSKSLFDYTISTLALYPSNNLYPSNSLFPSDFKIWWNQLPLDNDKFKKQYDCYNLKLLKKDLPESINNVFNIIKNGYKKI